MFLYIKSFKSQLTDIKSLQYFMNTEGFAVLIRFIIIIKLILDEIIIPKNMVWSRRKNKNGLGIDNGINGDVRGGG